MLGRIIILTMALSALAGCSTPWRDSNANPANWFSTDDRPETLVPIEEDLVIDNRPLVAQVTAVSVDRTPGGIIRRATGLPAAQGYWDAGLVLEQRDGEPVDGLLSFVFRATPPTTRSEGARATRELTVARFLSNQQLQGVSELRVVAEQNSRSVRP